MRWQSYNYYTQINTNIYSRSCIILPLKETLCSVTIQCMWAVLQSDLLDIVLKHSCYYNNNNNSAMWKLHNSYTRKQNWPYSLGRRDEVLCLTLSITARLTNHGHLWCMQMGEDSLPVSLLPSWCCMMRESDLGNGNWPCLETFVEEKHLHL